VNVVALEFGYTSQTLSSMDLLLDKKKSSATRSLRLATAENRGVDAHSMQINCEFDCVSSWE
jgi:hypothetical protein